MCAWVLCWVTFNDRGRSYRLTPAALSGGLCTHALTAGPLPSGEASPAAPTDSEVEAAYSRLTVLVADLQSSRGALEEAQAKVAALEAEKAEWAGQLQALKARAEAAEARQAALEQQLQKERAPAEAEEGS